VRSSKPVPTATADPYRSLHRVGLALAARNDAIAAQMVQRIRDQVPAYSTLEPAVFDRITELSTATSLAISDAMIRHIPVQRGDIPIIQEQAADRLRSGIDLESFLHAYRAALFFYWDTAMEEATRLRLTRVAGHSVGRFVLDSVDTITTHAAEAFLREDTRVRAATGRAVSELVDGLITGRPVQRGLRSVAPGLRPAGPVQVIIGRITEPAADLGAALSTALDILEQSLALGTARPLGTVHHEEVVVIAPGSPPVSRLHSAARAARERDVQLSIGASDSPTGFAGIPDAYAAAALTLSYTSPSRPVVKLTELGSLQLLLLSSGSDARELIREKSTPLKLLPQKEREITIETITAFVTADMNITSAASALHVHPNTVRYRLTRIAETTGLDPRTFTGLADLHCIIELQLSLRP
jgi:PucR C-terminal helix-turn-helix domain/GGDEF-like domain